MAKPALRSDDIAIDQVGTLNEADAAILADKDYQERLAMMEEPVTIEIGAGGGENPISHYFCQVNGKNPEILINGEWYPMREPYVPVGERMTLKRKYVAVLFGAKYNTVKTHIPNPNAERPQNLNDVTTLGMANVQIIHDANPKGPAWFADLRRRHF